MKFIPVQIFTGLRILGIIIAAIFFLSILWVAYYARFKVRTTPQMLFYYFEEPTGSNKSGYQWVPLDSISRNFVIAALAAADRNFYVHNGFPLLSPGDSSRPGIPRKHITISQKAAHAVFLTEGESKFKSFLEPYFTVLGEYMWGKDRILEIYLNTCLLGDGIFGIEAASRTYFNKSASGLTRNEAAFIAAFMEKQEKVDVKNPTDELLALQREILLRMGLMVHVKIGKEPVDEPDLLPEKPVKNKRKMSGYSYENFVQIA